MRFAAAVSLALVAGCAAHQAARAPELRSAEVAAAGARFRVEWRAGDDRAARQVIRALAAAAPRAQRWGALAHPVTITLHPDHEALAAAVERPGYPWLRAWARHSTIDLQSPRSWGLFPARERRVEELLAHELTHCAVYQLSGDELSWMAKGIPRWFGEGIATVTAAQGYRYAGMDELWAFYRAGAAGSGRAAAGRSRAAPAPMALAGDALVDPGLLPDRWRIAYGAAHHAFELLLRRHGEERVRRILALMGSGKPFQAAFEEAIGISEPEFVSEFRRYVDSEVWRRRAAAQDGALSPAAPAWRRARAGRRRRARRTSTA